MSIVAEGGHPIHIQEVHRSPQPVLVWEHPVIPDPDGLHFHVSVVHHKQVPVVLRRGGILLLESPKRMQRFWVFYLAATIVACRHGPKPYHI